MRTIGPNLDLDKSSNANLPPYFSATQTLDFSPAKAGLDPQLFFFVRA
jgi:hypothetical protein